MISGNTEIHEALIEIEPFGLLPPRLPGGSIPPNPSEMLGSARMSTILAELSEISDLVLIDTAPVLVVSDAFPLFDQVRGSSVSSEARADARGRRSLGRSRSRQARVARSDGRNRREAGRRGYGYGYGYGETPAAAADPHFLAASGGGQTPVGRSPAASGSSSGPADLRALPEQECQERPRAENREREQHGPCGGAGRSSARDAGA